MSRKRRDAATRAAISADVASFLRERPNAGAVESFQAGDCGTYLIIGKDVVAREYTVLLKDTEGKDVGVAKWPFDAQRGGGLGGGGTSRSKGRG